MRAPLSLRTQLLLLVGLPLLFLLVLEALASFLLAERMANLMFDLWLLDSVHSIAQEVRMRDDRIHFDADAEVLEVFGWDAVDDTYYQISTTAGEVIARNASLPPPDEHVLQAGASFADIAVGGRQVRMVSIAQRVGRELGVTVQVAETVDKRRWMMADIMVNVLVPKGVLIGFGMLLVGFALDRGLRPLSALTAEVDERSPRDLTPIALDRLPAELRGLSASTNKLLERLDRAIAAREQFIGNIAHQVRTPLAGIKLQAQLAMRETDPRAIHAACADIARTADHLGHVSSQLLKLARAEAAAGRGPHAAPCDFAALVRECCERAAPRALRHDIEIAFSAPRLPLEIPGEAGLLREMVDNLLENAFLYGRSGGQVQVSLERAGSRVRLVVEDDGPGIPPEHRGRIFERFYRPPHSPGDGCGLGLPIVGEIAQAHGAEVRLEDPAGATGTRCVVEFVDATA